MKVPACGECKHHDNDNTCFVFGTKKRPDERFCTYFKYLNGSKPRFCEMCSSVDKMASMMVEHVVKSLDAVLRSYNIDPVPLDSALIDASISEERDWLLEPIETESSSSDEDTGSPMKPLEFYAVKDTTANADKPPRLCSEYDYHAIVHDYVAAHTMDDSAVSYSTALHDIMQWGRGRLTPAGVVKALDAFILHKNTEDDEYTGA